MCECYALHIRDANDYTPSGVIVWVLEMNRIYIIRYKPREIAVFPEIHGYPHKHMFLYNAFVNLIHGRQNSKQLKSELIHNCHIICT